jgi:hypothetical protein
VAILPGDCQILIIELKIRWFAHRHNKISDYARSIQP